MDTLKNRVLQAISTGIMITIKGRTYDVHHHVLRSFEWGENSTDLYMIGEEAVVGRRVSEYFYDYHPRNYGTRIMEDVLYQGLRIVHINRLN